MPGVSVIIPTYNRAWCIAKAIESVLAQTYTEYEIIVIDDGSIDNTKQVLEPYMDSIQYIYQENSGVSAARNVGLRASKGKYILFLDSDDYIAECALEKQVDILESHPEIDWVYSRALVLDGSGKVLREYPGEKAQRPDGTFPEDDIFMDIFIRYGNFLPINSVVLKKDSIGSQLFDETLVGYEDWDFWTRFAANHKSKFVDDVLAFIVNNPGSAQSRIVEFKMDKAKVIKKIQQLYPEKTRMYKKKLSKKAADSYNTVASAYLKQGQIMPAINASIQSIKIHPISKHAYLNLGLTFLNALSIMWIILKGKLRIIFKAIKGFVPVFFKEAYKKVRAGIFSIGLSSSAKITLPESEYEASSEFSVILPIHDSPKVTRRCLNSLELYAGQAEVILVDDGSRLKETRELIADFQKRKGWKVIKNEKPVRHSRACEKGSGYAHRQYLCLLNSDTVVTPYSWVGIKDAFEADKKVAIVGPVTSTNTHQLASRRALYCNLYWDNNQIYHFAQQYILKQPECKWIETSSINGFAFFIRNSIWKECRGFHPDLPDYGNESELCQRILQKGFRIILTRNSYIHHFTGSSSIGQTMTLDDIVKRKIEARKVIDNLYGTK